MKFKHLKSALAYDVILPGVADTAQALGNRLHREITEREFETTGFHKCPETGELVTPFPDPSRGFSFVLRHDAKIIPAAVVKAEVEKRLLKLKAEDGVVPRGAEKRELAATVRQELAATALVKTTYTYAFYDAPSHTLFVSGTSKKAAGRLTGELVKAFGALKFSTVWFDGIKHGLTTRMSRWVDLVMAGEQFDAENAFDAFEPDGSVVLSGQGESVTLAVDDLTNHDRTLERLLGAGFDVSKVGLSYEEFCVSFTVDVNFRLTRVYMPAEGDYHDDPHFAWRTDAAIRTAVLADISNKLTAMLKPPVSATAESADDEELV